MGQMMTVELLKVALPKNLHSNATQELADQINNLAVAEPETAEEIRSNFLTYSKVLIEGKWKTEDYLNAVAYVTHKLMGYNNTDAYIRTFPARYQALVARGASSKDISAYVAAYHKNKLVNAIMEQTLIPAHLLYQDVFHKAIRCQADLMENALSEKVRAEAANSILTHLKAPEVKKVEMSVDVKNAGGIDDLRETMQALAKRQLEAIEAGMVSPGEVAGQKLRLSPQEKAEAIDVTPAPPVFMGVDPAAPDADHTVMADQVFEEQFSPAPPEAEEPEQEPERVSGATLFSLGEAADVEPPARAQPDAGVAPAARPTLFPSLFNNPHQD